MAVQTLETLKGYFKAGEYPTQSNYEDLIDTIFSLTPSSDNNFLQVNIPTYTVAKIGDIVQHIGLTSGDYTHGYVYQCTKNVKAGDWILTVELDSDTIDRYNLPVEGTYYTYEDITFDDLTGYIQQPDSSYQIRLYDLQGSSISDISVNDSDITKHSLARTLKNDVIEVIIYDGTPYRRTGSYSSSSGTTFETWQEVSGTAVVSPSIEWERINVQPQLDNGIVKQISLSSYSPYTGLAPSYFDYIDSPYTPLQIGDIARGAGLPENGEDFDQVASSSTAILIVHNDGFWYGYSSTPSENNEVYVSWKASGREGAHLVMATQFTDPRYWDTNMFPKTQVVVIPCGCSVAFGLSAGGWQPLGTFTPISASDLQTKEDEYLNN